MAALYSARRGDRGLTWRDWLAGYAATWILPVPLGLLMLVLPVLYMWPFDALGWPIPAQEPVSYIFGLGWVVLFTPMLSWIGLLISAPLVWAVLRLGLGGWVNFLLGGALAGALAASFLDGMHALFPASVGAVSGVTCRLVFNWLRPEVFDQEQNFGHGPS